MLIAHLPLGYLIGVGLACRVGTGTGLVLASLVGSVAPDVDLLRFYLLDSGQYNHRFYFTHWPLFWVFRATLLLPLFSRFRRNWLLPAVGFWLGVASHLIVDTLQGPVRWLAPFSTVATEIVVVPATKSHFLLSYVLHWSFAVELVLFVVASFVWWRNRQATRNEASLAP